MTKFNRFILKKTYHINPVTIAFIDGSIISAAINLLTGMASYDGNEKWVALVASLILIIDSVLLLIWQNAASKLQGVYKPWVEFISTQNRNSNAADQQKSTDWIAFVEECNEKCKKINSAQNLTDDDSKKPVLPKYSIRRLVLYPICSCFFFLVGIGLMIWSFF